MNRAFNRAWERGREDASLGRPRTANPYPDTRTENGSVTFSRAFWRKWDEGWCYGSREATLAMREADRQAGVVDLEHIAGGAGGKNRTHQR